MRPIAWIIILFVLVIAPSTYAQQAITDETIIERALAATDFNCAGLARNEACYGHVQLQARPQAGVDAFDFDHAGDITDVANIQSLRMNGLDSRTGVWGVTKMQLQANLPDSAPESVTFLAFGEVDLLNAVASPTRLTVTIAADAVASIRSRPSLASGVIARLESGDRLTALERLADNTWLRVELPDSDFTGWLQRDQINIAPINALNVVQRGEAYFSPMQAFFFRSGQDGEDAVTSKLPPSGLLIQTPEGVGEISLLINEITVQMGSTVFFQAVPGDHLTVSTLEGHARVRVSGFEQIALAGTYVTVPLNNSGTPEDLPAPPQPYDPGPLEQLPLGLLGRTITVSPPLSEHEINIELSTLGLPPLYPDAEAPPPPSFFNVQGPFDAGSGGFNQEFTPPGQDFCGPPSSEDCLPPGLRGEDEHPGQEGGNPALGGNPPPGQSGQPPPSQGGSPPEQANPNAGGNRPNG